LTSIPGLAFPSVPINQINGLSKLNNLTNTPSSLPKGIVPPPPPPGLNIKPEDIPQLAVGMELDEDSGLPIPQMPGRVKLGVANGGSNVGGGGVGRVGGGGGGGGGGSRTPTQVQTVQPVKIVGMKKVEGDRIKREEDEVSEI
jgi:hypothetical protein